MRRDAWAGLAAVSATYLSFLLHAQFAFLALIQRELGSARAVAIAMAAMGVSGALCSLAAGWLLKRLPARRLVIGGLAACAALAIASLACRTLPQFGIVAALVGLATGALTVSVATDLRALVPGPGRGVRVGLATGIAYLVANVPAIFHGGPALQSATAAVACAVAAACLLVARVRPQAEVAEPAALGATDSRGIGFASLVLAFLALVWLDSAAFRIITETAALQGSTWGDGGRTLVQGLAHLVAAILAGRLIDRGLFRSLLVTTLGLFLAGFALLTSGMATAMAGPLYAAGISAYSTALVLAPSLGPEAPGLVPRRLRAAILYAVAGWLGSALGVGMAQDLHRIPGAFVAAASVVLLGGALLARPRRGARLLRAAGGAAILAIVGIAHDLRGASAVSTETAGPVERGRRAYVAEGCIHCHSQYVRPGPDEIAWGPLRTDQLAEKPPLLGTRRLGPDLLDVGNRRDARWQRLHLVDPRSLVPSSRMPSYEHLFREGDTRGEDLVAYLGSLGRKTLGERVEATRRAPVPGRTVAADIELGRRVFDAGCAPCHGRAGRGDGALSAGVASPFLDILMPGLPRCERVTGDEVLDLQRLIRYGSCGTPMAGHELLADRELASVTAWVQALRAGTAP